MQEVCQNLLSKPERNIMTDEELTQMLEESWYFSVIEDIVQLFAVYGKDNVLTDVANRLIEIEHQGKQ